MAARELRCFVCGSDDKEKTYLPCYHEGKEKIVCVDQGETGSRLNKKRVSALVYSIGAHVLTKTRERADRSSKESGP